jgi:hypothetical protein
MNPQTPVFLEFIYFSRFRILDVMLLYPRMVSDPCCYQQPDVSFGFSDAAYYFCGLPQDFPFLSFIIYTQVFYLPDPRALLFPLEPPHPNSSPHPKAQVLQGTPEKNESWVKGMPGLFVQL